MQKKTKPRIFFLSELLIKLSQEKKHPVPDHDLQVTLTVLGLIFNAMVDTGSRSSVKSTAAVTQMHLQQFMDREQTLANLT